MYLRYPRNNSSGASESQQESNLVYVENVKHTISA